MEKLWLYISIFFISRERAAPPLYVAMRLKSSVFFVSSQATEYIVNVENKRGKRNVVNKV